MILVTGGTGLVGAHLLVQLTQKKESVRAIRRKNSNLKAVEAVFAFYDATSDFSKIEWVEADITDTTSLEPIFKNIDYVYHSAAMISFHPKRYKDMRKINIEGTANIVNFCIASGVKKLCHVSSVAAVGKTINNQAITESTEWSVETSNYGYAITKYGAEMEVWRGTQEGLDAVIVNPGIILGEGFWNSGSGKIFSKVYKGMKYYTHGITGYVDVRDVVKSMILLMDSSIKNERYILVSENRSYKSVFSEISRRYGKKEPFIRVSEFMTEIGWRVALIISFFTGSEPMLTKHSSKSIHRNSEFSSHKIKKELNFEFNPISNIIKRVCNNYIS
jgi:dihydroflavonol-4-reductase